MTQGPVYRIEQGSNTKPIEDHLRLDVAYIPNPRVALLGCTLAGLTLTACCILGTNWLVEILTKR